MKFCAEQNVPLSFNNLGEPLPIYLVMPSGGHKRPVLCCLLLCLVLISKCSHAIFVPAKHHYVNMVIVNMLACRC